MKYALSYINKLMCFRIYLIYEVNIPNFCLPSSSYDVNILFVFLTWDLHFCYLNFSGEICVLYFSRNLEM